MDSSELSTTAEVAVGGSWTIKRVRVNGVEAEARLDEAAGTFRWWNSTGVERCLNLESDVLGLEPEGTKVTLRAFLAESNAASSCGGSGGAAAAAARRVRRDYVLQMPTKEAAMSLSQRLKNYIDSLGRPKRLFIIVNPYGGKRSALKIFHNEIKPLLVAADTQYLLLETKYQLHAQEVACSLDILKYDGIVCVSGDGVLVEVVNGLLQREDWNVAIKVPLGIIPAGTGNGMAKSLLHSAGDLCSVPNATFAIIRGHKQSLDVTTVLQGQKKFFSVLMLTWGLIADIDIESEKYRWMGSARLDFYSILRIINLRKYHGHIQFVPAPGYEKYGQPIKQADGFSGDFGLHKQGQLDNESQSSGYPGSVTSFEGSEWRSLDGPFILIWLNNVPWSGEDIMPAPQAKFSDGFLDAVIMRDCPKSALLGLMLMMADGSHVQSPYVTYLKVKAFRLEPGKRVGHTNKGGIVDADGEVIAREDGLDGNQQKYLLAYGPPIQMHVDQGLATIFAPQ